MLQLALIQYSEERAMSAGIRDVIILGSGPAGLTAAVYAARANLSPLLFHGPLPGGQLTTTTEVENYPGFAKGIMGPELMDEMRKQAERFGTEIVQAVVEKVELGSQPFVVRAGNREERCRVLLIASGASPRKFGLPKEQELMGYGLSTCATCDGAFFRDAEIVVIGGGDSACEEAGFLTKFGKRVRVVHRRDELRASKIMAERLLKNPKVEMVWNHIPVELLGDPKGGLKGVVVEDVKSKARTTLDCAAVFYAIGHIPNSQLFKGQLELDENGYILTKANSTQTNIPGVFACGDVQDHVYRQAVTAAGSGCMGAIEAERYLAALSH
jgi:thioredoxin reductase (NADPH)